MATHSLPYLTTLLSFLIITFSPQQIIAARLITAQPTSTDFIKTSCRSTTYPSLCFSSLSSYAGAIQTSHMLLAHTALSVSLDSTRSMSTYMKKMSVAGGMTPMEAGAMNDCLEMVGDAMRELKDAMLTMGHMGGREFGFQLNSVQTWLSAALTDEDTCMDGFEGSADGTLKKAIRGRVVGIAQLTSNALALVNCLVSP